jgi:hypothetical protein
LSLKTKLQASIQRFYSLVFGQGNGGYDPETNEPVLTPVDWAVTVKDFVPDTNDDYDMNY